MLKLTQLPQDFTATLKAMHTAEKLVFHYKRLSSMLLLQLLKNKHQQMMVVL